VNALLGIAWLIVIPLDAVRFHWSHMPLALQIVGAIVLVGFMPLAILTFREHARSKTGIIGQLIGLTPTHRLAKHTIGSRLLAFSKLLEYSTIQEHSKIL
jgi:hypothetical protein